MRFIAPEGLESRVGPEGLEVALEAGEMVVELELVQDSLLKQEMPENEWLRDGKMKMVIVGMAGAIHAPVPSQIDPFTSGSRFSGEEIERFGRR